MLAETLGADETIEQLYERYHEAVVSYCMHVLQGQKATSEDLAQETFARLVKHHPELRERYPWNPKGWLFKTATNLCIDWLRRKQVQRHALEAVLLPLLRQYSSGSWDASAEHDLPPAIRVVPAELSRVGGGVMEIELCAEQGPEERLFSAQLEEWQQEVLNQLIEQTHHRGALVSDGWHLLLHIASQDSRISIPELAANHGLSITQVKVRLCTIRRLARQQVGKLPPELALAAWRERVGRMAESTQRVAGITVAGIANGIGAD